MAERIVVLNGYGGSNQQGWRLAAMVRGLAFTVALISELGRLVDDLERIGKVYYNKGDDPRDVGIVVSNPVLGRVGKAISWTGRQLTRFVHRGGDKPMLWRDRWVVRVRIFNRVYYSIHGNAVIDERSGDGWLANEGARVWREALQELRKMIRDDMKKGLRVRIGGDFNFPKGDAPLSPNELFEDLGLIWRSDGRVMFFAFDPRKDVLAEFKVLPTAPGADAHQVLFAVLKKRPRKDRQDHGKDHGKQ